MASPVPGDLAEIAALIAREAGELVRSRIGDVAGIGTKSSATDMVTEVDRQSERLIVERLASLRPGDGLLGEEGTIDAGTTGVRWIFDPLDGTTNYIYGYPAFCVAIAAEAEDEVVAGAVFDALRGEMFVAAKGSGARRDGRSIHVTDQPDVSQALVATGFGYSQPRRAFQGRVLADIVPLVRDVRRGGSAALDLCWVACGRLDAYYELGLNPWDMAAGALLVREAGGVIGDFQGAPPGANTIVASGPGIFGELRRIVDESHLRHDDLRA